MRQLTSLDAMFLAMESPTTFGHFSILVTMNGAVPIELDAVQALISERLPLLPSFRWRLQEVPLGLDHPYWIDDPDFDLEYHVRELAVPAPATAEKVATLIASIQSRPLDRSRPLWELYLIHGLPDGETAVLAKMHHAAVDGVSGTEILSILLDLKPEGRPQPAPQQTARDRRPSELEMLGRGLLGTPRYLSRVVRALPSTLPNIEDSPLLGGLPGAPGLGRVAKVVTKLLGGSTPEPAARKLTAKPLTFNGRISPHRRFAYGQLPLGPVKRIKNTYGCTVNDVVVALCAGVTRRWLIEHNELPAQPLVLHIPISVRGSAKAGAAGNEISVISTPFHTGEPDAVRRLQLTHESLKVAKDRHKALPASLLQDSAHFIPPALFAQATRASLALSAKSPMWNVEVSNVPGPALPLFFAGAQVHGIFPVPPISDGLGLNYTLISYQDTLGFGITVDREQVPDVWKLIGWLHEELAELERAAVPA